MSEPSRGSVEPSSVERSVEPSQSPAASNRRDRISSRDRDESHDQDDDHHDSNGSRPPPRKRQRVRLSCLECRRRKLSCDREFPCSRCMQSGTPERCEYETRPGLAPPNKLGLSHSALAGFDSRLSLPNGGSGDSSYYRKDARESERIRRLELEIAQLKNIVLKQHASLDGSTVTDNSPPMQKLHAASGEDQEIGAQYGYNQFSDAVNDESKEELRFLRGKEFKTRYFGPHSASRAFSELAGLCHFMKETSEEFFRPFTIPNTKDRQQRTEEREIRFHQADESLESLLPSKERTDSLVTIYLDQFEQIHRIVHIPTFRRDYDKFWDPAQTRSAAFTALILAILGVSSCLGSHFPQEFDKMISRSHADALKWIDAVDEWQQKQSQKHRRLIHYQIACLVYLAKRVNTVKKKRFWKGAGAMSMDAISVGLHLEPSHNISPFNQELRRRIWATIQSFDLQASFDMGLPSILGALHFNVEPPRNIDDDEFDENSKELPPSKPPTEYTFSSYQHLSRQSLDLRLDLIRVLNGPCEKLDYDQIIRYTNEINQEIDSLPSWDVTDAEAPTGVLKKPLLAYTLLHIQLRQFIIKLHHPYLKLRKDNSKYQYSEIIYYNAARDMVLLNDKLAQQGIRTLNYLREDCLTLAINLCSVTMLQPRGSTNMIMINSQHTLQLLEKCLAIKEDRILRCGNNEPWGYSIMCAAVGLLEAHLGVKTTEQAKATSAERFIKLHCKLVPMTQGGAGGSNESQPSSSQERGHQCGAEKQEDAERPPQQPGLAGNRESATPVNGQPADVSGGVGNNKVAPNGLATPSNSQFLNGIAADYMARLRPPTPFLHPGNTQQQPQQAPMPPVTLGPAVDIPGTPWSVVPGVGLTGAGGEWSNAGGFQFPNTMNSEFDMTQLGASMGELWPSDLWDLI
ncbi:hypothetical protein GE21DRAFT_2839 [Neurospora crassa]|uniref:Zn(2)-C6 fungal-type domain-containing protein n=1 Tax=Neurospora crassa (strain ATCC 24698 / 74-OR23-1A / CBS 708.71 / DSM 1257 / FGSC 987) TaxID=367110 RepID=Q7RY04_NEUCR|nr:hypothetical protein NCU03417 [Neurospora crassa OR74A]EAA27628.3 hypothetical protein NCU03417 [Neurospora crassa OR74A]KHE86390.1 hypothetical protein GE21DRAFT_2839 [Neurospora crassa]|eukprot:XP_956864.3 hypothetical protein NCU03417 [Neurospora crassa OR74A]